MSSTVSMTTNRPLKIYGIVSTLAILALVLMGAEGPSETTVFDKITVRHIDVVDSEGRVRVQLAGEYAPRRKDLAGLLFHNEDGHEAGGLVYTGRADETGKVQAGAILTFDQYGEDQIMAIRYSQDGEVKQNGMTITDRPNEMGENMAKFYRAFSEAKTEEERRKLRDEMLPTIPREELPAKRLFLGRTARNSSTINLYDPLGRVRLRLEVGDDGAPQIEFLDEQGESVKRIAIENAVVKDGVTH
jgi:hypothetical protein